MTSRLNLLSRRYRVESRTYQVPHTVDGATEMVTRTEQVTVPVPPRDWDHLILNAVTGTAALMMAGTVAWSTASIGDLLNRGVPAAVAYVAATVFDIAWIMAMALEWLARYEPAKAGRPRRAGHFALGMAVAAVAVHGYLVGSLVVGLVGAMVSVIVKRVWTLVLAHHAKPLDDLTAQWVQQRMAAAGAQLAMMPVRRQLARAAGALTAEHAALGTSAAAQLGAGPDASGQVEHAVRIALDTMPDATPTEIVDQLELLGITATEDLVRTLSGQTGQQVTGLPGTQAETMTDTIRRLVRDGVRTPELVLLGVQAAHGPSVNPETVRRTYTRVTSGGNP